MKAYAKLKQQFANMSKFNYLQSILTWDEAVMTPEGAGETMGASISLLTTHLHKLLTAPKIKKLIQEAKDELNGKEWDKANLGWIEKKFLRASCIPSSLSQKFSVASFDSQQAWRKYRKENNWKLFYPYQEKTFRIAQEMANRYSQVLGLDPYDAMLDEYVPGFNQVSIDKYFSQLLQKLPELIDIILEKQRANKLESLKGPFDITLQKKLGVEVMEALQFNFNYGRLDTSHHPFCTGYPTDVRITTRYTTNDFLSSLMGICHETGHGLYEQGLPSEWIDQPVGRIHSMAMHESQSLLMEMQVCKSRSFAEYISPLVKNYFGNEAAFNAANLYFHINEVKKQFIRVDADEVTYPLHVILRYEIEKKLFKGEITIKDLPLYWNDFMERYLGLSTLNNDKDGVMQDVHWPLGAFGYFPAYTLGRLIAAQLYHACEKQVPNLPSEISQGNFKHLHDWLKENVYSFASSLSTSDFLMKVTGEHLNIHYFINYIQKKWLENTGL